MLNKPECHVSLVLASASPRRVLPVRQAEELNEALLVLHLDHVLKAEHPSPVNPERHLLGQGDGAERVAKEGGLVAGARRVVLHREVGDDGALAGDAHLHLALKHKSKEKTSSFCYILILSLPHQRPRGGQPELPPFASTVHSHLHVLPAEIEICQHLLEPVRLQDDLGGHHRLLEVKV